MTQKKGSVQYRKLDIREVFFIIDSVPNWAYDCPFKSILKMKLKNLVLEENQNEKI